MGTEEDGRVSARAVLDEAARVREQARRSGRWHSGFLAAFGAVAIAWIVLLESVWPHGAARAYVTAGGVLVVGAANWWAERRQVLPAGASRRLAVAGVAWFALYLVAIGPVARWKLEESLPGWTAAATVMALPFFIAAWAGRRA
ncbi:hypothetical protein [Spirillospora sp. NPDC029432]|uniref:hypothetical protein n=1 Tax=Spirillospora sp. NPDC029432 TaxID=3154599 RepID=UPI0034550304